MGDLEDDFALALKLQQEEDKKAGWQSFANRHRDDDFFKHTIATSSSGIIGSHGGILGGTNTKSTEYSAAANPLAPGPDSSTTKNKKLRQRIGTDEISNVGVQENNSNSNYRNIDKNLVNNADDESSDDAFWEDYDNDEQKYEEQGISLFSNNRSTASHRVGTRDEDSTKIMTQTRGASTAPRKDIKKDQKYSSDSTVENSMLKNVKKKGTKLGTSDSKIISDLVEQEQPFVEVKRKSPKEGSVLKKTHGNGKTSSKESKSSKSTDALNSSSSKAQKKMLRNRFENISDDVDHVAKNSEDEDFLDKLYLFYYCRNLAQDFGNRTKIRK